MKLVIRKLTLLLALAATCGLPGAVVAHNVDPMPWIVPSLGVIPATAITIDASDAEWPGSAVPFSIADYGALGGGISPVSAQARVLHKADGIYVYLEINDGGSTNNNDAVQLRFDVNHNATPAPEASDWGVQVLRNGQATWGAANTDVGSWALVPAGTVAVSPVGTNPWRVEMRVPTGAPTGINLASAVVGVHFMIYDVDQVLGLNNAKYTQWPQPTVAEMPGGIDALFDDKPPRWGNYEFDLPTTFPDVAITEVRNVFNGPENYRKISHMADNVFQVTVNNPGGTAVPEPTNVRLNLYLAARGIGEPWHRIDTEDRINSDCAAANWPYTVIAKSNVCSGNVSLDDISAQNINAVVAGTAKYTTKLGTPMSRLGGESMTLPVGSSPIDVLEWNTTPAQDDFYKEVMVSGTTYRRQHQCMKAEAVVPGDPNPSNNTRQVNMDFVCVPGAQMKMFMFTIGSAGFGKYDPNTGKDMVLQLVTHNIDPKLGWKFGLKGAKQVNESAWVANVRGKKSLPLELGILAPAEERLGRALKRNLMVPPRAGGDQPSAKSRSGLPPVYVKVAAGSAIQVANYSFEHNDEQFVDLDGKAKNFRPNGPAGYLPARMLKKYGVKNLMAPHAPVGALIGSFDNFASTFLIAEGVQVQVPAGATHLALGINDFDGQYKDNAGTGFRLKIMELPIKTTLLKQVGDAASALIAAPANAASSPATRIKTIPIQQAMPTVCLQGYADIGQVRVVGDAKRRLHRFVGDVCWGLLNVYDAKHSHDGEGAKPDQGDPFKAPPTRKLTQRLFGS